MSERKTEFGQDPRWVREERDNRGTDHSDPRQIDPESGVDDVDTASFLTKGGVRPDHYPDQGVAGTLNEMTAPDGGIAIGGGKLAGNHDDFAGDLGHIKKPVPGANANNEIQPAHDLTTGDSGKTENPD